MEAVNNPNPVVYSLDGDDQDDHQTLMNLYQLPDDDLDESIEPFDALEVFDLLRNLRDPEHPQLTLEQLKVIEKRLILVENDLNNIQVLYTPTVPHCSMATLIGLCIRVKLLRSLPSRFKVQVKISPGSHASELDVNKQLNDKERVAAALENQNLMSMIDGSIRDTDSFQAYAS